MRRLQAVAIVVILISVSALGCSSDDSSDSPNRTTTTTAREPDRLPISADVARIEIARTSLRCIGRLL